MVLEKIKMIFRVAAKRREYGESFGLWPRLSKYLQ